MNKFQGMYPITAAIAESEPVHERLFNQPARPLRPELRALLARLDREAADRAVARRDMAAMKGSAGTVAHEADAIAAALRAAGLDPDAPEAYTFWDVWQEEGYSAACAALNRKGTAMEIVFNPDAPWTEATKHDAHGAYTVQRQAVWQQLESDAWLEVVIERTGQLRAGQQAAPYIADAIRREGHQPDDSWRHAQPIDRTRLRLAPQATAPRTSPPAPPARPAHTGQRYIDRAYGQTKAAE